MAFWESPINSAKLFIGLKRPTECPGTNIQDAHNIKDIMKLIG